MAPKLKPAPQLKIRLKFKTAKEPKSLKLPAVLAKPTEENNSHESFYRPLNLRERVFPKVVTEVNKPGTTTLKEYTKGKDNEGNREEVASVPTKTVAEPARRNLPRRFRAQRQRVPITSRRLWLRLPRRQSQS